MTDTNMTPLLSICMSTFEHQSFIAQAIEGVLMQQTQFPIQLVIGDDLSSDHTRSICEAYQNKYPEKIKLLDSNKKYGQSLNLTRIIDACDGKYIALCEGDDFWTDPYKLQKQVNFLESHPDFVLCFHKVDEVDENNKMLLKAAPSEVIYYEDKDFFHTSYPTLSLVFRNYLRAFPEEFYHIKSTDAFLFAMLSAYGKGANLGFVGGSYRKHIGGCYNRLNTVKKYKQTLHTRKLMFRSSYFTKQQREEIQKEIIRRKVLYAKILLKKSEVLNCINVVFS